MRILGIESSSLVASIAIWTDDSITAEYTFNFKKTHSQTLLPMLDEIIKMTEIPLDTIDAIAVSAGPGSFTGLRIGSATAKGLGLAMKKPLIHIPTIEAMAYQCFSSSYVICPIMDARRNQVYTGIYKYDGEKFITIMNQTAMDIKDLMDTVNGLEDEVMFLGDGVPVYKETIEHLSKQKCHFAPSFMNRQRAGAVAALGANYFLEGKIESAMGHQPDYLRKSQAERELEEKNKE